jgi:hypothetical protein
MPIVLSGRRPADQMYVGPSRLPGVFEDSQISAELETRTDELIVGQLQLVVNQPDFSFFHTGNHLVGGGDHEKAIQQCQLLSYVCHRVEFLGYKKILRAPEQCCLCFSDLHDEDGLFRRKTTQANDLIFHLPRLGIADVHVGVRYAAENVGKSGNV